MVKSGIIRVSGRRQPNDWPKAYGEGAARETQLVTVPYGVAASAWLLFALLACACSGRPAPASVRDGDIIFQTSMSSQSVAIQRATGSRFSHMGMVFYRDGKPFVLEASATVRYTPLETWIQRGAGHRYQIKRLRNAIRRS